ncbi:site-specific integrase [Shewanella nanhaiensis]|uniref:Site-specific integrase n=1 Tax=Shewanella nanhaiensis TaxID=2864872 RepID=A0ABS7E753_9GAMM|nr:site-specific integrase [Shewanella nanhaiensis]MBW8185513.1 site-specific integrase [Shewanella nanhaiensis]
MYKVINIDDERACLFDASIMQPTFLSLKFCIDSLFGKSINYQKHTLVNVQYFHEYWYAKFGYTLDYSMYQSEFSGTEIAKMISELEGFWIYLCHKRTYVENLSLFPIVNSKVTIQEIVTAVSRYQTICRFICWLIETYINTHYLDESFNEIYACQRALMAKLSIESKKYSKYSSSVVKKKKTLYRSLTTQQLKDFVSLFSTNAEPEKYNGLLKPSFYRQYRDFILVKFLVSYGLRIGEALLLRGTSFKTNLKATKFVMLIDTLEDGIDSRRNKPRIKSNNSVRELEISYQDYTLVQSFIKDVNFRCDHGFVFTSSIGNFEPLSYKAAYKVVINASEAAKKRFPEHFAPTNVDYLENIHPHMLRHTWAYNTLAALYDQEKKAFIRANAVNVKGIMESAKDKLRVLGGWADNSDMPSHYARRFIAENANKINLSMFTKYTWDASFLTSESD